MPRCMQAHRIVAIIALNIFILPGCGFSSRDHKGAENFTGLIQQAQEAVFPALVFIKPVRQQLASGESVRMRVFGSGIIIREDGLVVTNSHVARNATDIKCVLYNREQLPATVVGFDEVIDVALLKLELPDGHPPLPSVEFGNSDALHPGQFLMALGSPFGFNRSISFGIISSTRRYLDTGHYHLWIQTDAAINPGNSGGPLVDARGRVIGINTMRASRGDNIGFAIPSNTVRNIVTELLERGRIVRTYTGLHFQPIRDFLSDTVLQHDTGVLVRSVDEGSPAGEAGIQAGDIILRCNGQAVNGLYLEDLPAIRSLFAGLPAGSRTEIRLLRQGKALETGLTPIVKQVQRDDGLELPKWNCSVQQISQFRTPGLAHYMPHGIYVLGVRQPGNAYNSGLRAEDIILSVDGASVHSLEEINEIYQRLSRLDPGDRLTTIHVLRHGYKQMIALDFNQDLGQ